MMLWPRNSILGPNGVHLPRIPHDFSDFVPFLRKITFENLFSGSINKSEEPQSHSYAVFAMQLRYLFYVWSYKILHLQWIDGLS